MSYQWRLNGGDIPGATASSFARTNVLSAEAGSYVAIVSNAGGSATSQLAAVTVNNPPVLDSVGAQIVHAGTPVQIANAAFDPDPGQVLTFSLETGAPAGASIGAADGLFAWATTDANANTTNAVTVRVTDDGTPSLSDTWSFSIAVVGRPLILSSAISSNMMWFSWSAVVGQTYRIQYRTSAGDADWSDLLDVIAPGQTAVAADIIDSGTGAIRQKFYRVLVVQ